MCETMKNEIKNWAYLSLCTAVLISNGCEPAPPSRQELGRIVFNESEVPGTDKPYIVPEYLRELAPDEATKPPHEHPE
jgi:hypothetical protein